MQIARHAIYNAKQPCNMRTNDDDNNRNVCMTVVHAIDFECILAANLIKMSTWNRKMPENYSTRLVEEAAKNAPKGPWVSGIALASHYGMRDHY